MNGTFCYVKFSFLSTNQEIGWENHLKNDLFCVKWGIKPYCNQLLYCCCLFLKFHVCICQRVMPSSTPPRQPSMPLSPSSSYPPIPGGQVVYPTPQPPPTFVSVPQSQSNQRVTAGHQNKRGICYSYYWRHKVSWLASKGKECVQQAALKTFLYIKFINCL